jgi:enoyl-CoA hydratase
VADYQFVLYEPLDEGRIVRIMLNRPESRNAQNRGLLVELNDAFLQAEADDEVRVVILGGTGPMFSSGHDLGSKVSLEEMMPGPNQHPTRTINGGTRQATEGLMLQEWHYYFENTRRWRNLRKITIGQAHGDVYAAGLMLLWACDLIVAADSTRFADVVGTRLGMCGVEYFAHPWEFGPRRTKELMLTGDSVDADEAYRLGMVDDRVRPTDRPAADHDRAHDQRGGQPNPGQHGLLQRLERLLHPPRAEPFALGVGQRGPLSHRQGGLGHT